MHKLLYWRYFFNCNVNYHYLYPVLQIIWKYFLDTQSFKEHGTMYQLKNLINRSNVTTIPKHNFNTCDDFLRLIINCFILTAAMKTLGMKELDNQPSSSHIPEDVKLKSAEERKTLLENICKKIVDDFIHTEFKPLSTSVPINQVSKIIHNNYMHLINNYNYRHQTHSRIR